MDEPCFAARFLALVRVKLYRVPIGCVASLGVSSCPFPMVVMTSLRLKHDTKLSSLSEQRNQIGKIASIVAKACTQFMSKEVEAMELDLCQIYKWLSSCQKICNLGWVAYKELHFQT